MADSHPGAIGDASGLLRLLCGMPVGVVRLLGDGGIEWLNERAARLLAGPAIGARPANLADARGPAAAALREALADGRPIPDPIVVPAAAGTGAHGLGEVSIALAPVGGGRWIATLWDAAHEERGPPPAGNAAAGRIAELAAELEAMVGAFGMSVSRQDLETGLIVVGPGASAWIGLPGEARGVTIDEMLAFVHPDDRPMFLEDRERALAGTRMEYREFRVRHVDGSWHTMRGRRVVENGPDGRPRAMTTLGLDVTDVYAAESAGRAQSEFLSRVGHELRTPLNAILGFANLLLARGDPGLSPSQQSQVAHIVNAGRHLLRLIGDLADATGMASGRLRVTLGVVDAGALARELLHAMAAEAAAHGIELRLEPVAPAAWPVRADATRLRQVLSNLLSNAIKYNRPGGRVTVHLRRRRERVLIGVIDTGIGMTDEQRAALYQPFNRLGRDAGDIPGTGLGLVIARQFVEAMGGRIDVTSTPRRGSIFRVDLPAASARAVGESGLSGAATTKAATTEAATTEAATTEAAATEAATIGVSLPGVPGAG